MRPLQKIKADFDAKVRNATSEAEIDDAIADGLEAVARHASVEQIATALAITPLTAEDRCAIGKIFGVEVGTA